MKKSLFIVAFLTFITTFSQEIHLGVKGGLNIAQTTRSRTDARITYHFGVMTEFKTNERFAFQPEILYSAQGYAFKSTNTEYTYKYDYLTIPVMFKYYVSDNINLQIGPQFSFNINTEEEFSGTNGSISQEKTGLKTFEFGMNVGGTYTLNNRLNLGLRYNLGMTDIYKIPYDGDTPTRNSVLQISIGYFFK